MSEPRKMNHGVHVIVIRKKNDIVENIWYEDFENLSSEEAARRYARCMKSIIEVGESEDIG